MWVEDDTYGYRWTPVNNVHIQDNVRRPTGLVDGKGRRIYREPNEIGFGRKQDVYSVE